MRANATGEFEVHKDWAGGELWLQKPVEALLGTWRRDKAWTWNVPALDTLQLKEEALTVSMME